MYSQHCEMESKKKEIMELAEKLGIADKLNFLDDGAGKFSEVAKKK